ncbi:Putative Mce family protein [Mycobacteroides abscessus]|nr:Putative Mce family protein [Mycobacteroides abscessus]
MKRIAFLMAGLTAIVAVAVVLTLIIVNALRTPVNGPVRHYDALFTDASGLIVGNDVRISGVQVGKVEKIHLDGKNARITFNVLTDHPLYQNTTVAIRYQSLVGQRYVEIAQAPTPSAPLAAGTTIPLGQTIPSFVHPVDVLYSVIKAVVFVVIIIAIQCYQGYYAGGGPEGVGMASGRAIRASLVAVVLFDMLLTLLFWGNNPGIQISG